MRSLTRAAIAPTPTGTIFRKTAKVQTTKGGSWVEGWWWVGDGVGGGRGVGGSKEETKKTLLVDEQS